MRLQHEQIVTLSEADLIIRDIALGMHPLEDIAERLEDVANRILDISEQVNFKILASRAKAIRSRPDRPAVFGHDRGGVRTTGRGHPTSHPASPKRP